MYSPYTQAQRHKDIIMRIWKEKHNGFFDNLFIEKTVNDYFQPLVVMANSNGILNTKYAPNEVKQNTIRSDQLIARLKEDVEIAKKKDAILSSQKQMSEIAESWLKRNVESKKDYLSKYKILEKPADNSSTHIQIESNQELLRDNLKQLRTERSKSMNIPAYYVFNDNQLKKLVNQRPKSLDDLKEVLEPIKIKCHGKEILDIINKESI